MEYQILPMIIGLLVVSGVVIGISTFAGDFYNRYGVSSTDLSYLNKTKEISESAESVRDSIEGTQFTGTFLDLPLTFIAGAFESLKIIFSLPAIFTSFITDAGQVLNLPSWSLSMASTIVFIIIIFVVLMAIIKWKL